MNPIQVLSFSSTGDAFRQGFDAFFLSIGVIIAIVVGVIVLVVISAVAIICCCCTKRHKGLVYRQTRNGEKTNNLRMRKNKDADQLHRNREADQRLCFRYMDSTLPLLLKSDISSF